MTARMETNDIQPIAENNTAQFDDLVQVARERFAGFNSPKPLTEPAEITFDDPFGPKGSTDSRNQHTHDVPPDAPNVITPPETDAQDGYIDVIPDLPRADDPNHTTDSQDGDVLRDLSGSDAIPKPLKDDNGGLVLGTVGATNLADLLSPEEK